MQTYKNQVAQKRRKGHYVTVSGFGARLWWLMYWSQWEMQGDKTPTYLRCMTSNEEMPLGKWKDTIQKVGKQLLFFLFVLRFCLGKAPVFSVIAVSSVMFGRTCPIWLLVLSIIYWGKNQPLSDSLKCFLWFSRGISSSEVIRRRYDVGFKCVSPCFSYWRQYTSHHSVM